MQWIAMQDENAHISKLQVARVKKKYGRFYKNNYDVALNPNTEILPLMGSKEESCTYHLLF
jgi:aspartate/methionine/tyrosine aminotransferase